jgi:RNA polymerase sigma-70 factor (ECF subfamily)
MAIHLADETALLNQARVGDREAFGLLVQQYYQNIFQLAFRITRNREDAEDALQEAVLKAQCNLGKFQGNSRFSTWLARIAINEALIRLRSRRTQREVSLDELSWSDGVRWAPLEAGAEICNPERRYAEVELNERLGKALDGLGPHLRTVFILRNVDGFSTAELAQMLGLSLAAIKSRLLRARLKLRVRFRRVLKPQSGESTMLTREASA